MTIRFFILSAHYRGTVDFSNEALQAAEKGYERLMNGIEDLHAFSLLQRQMRIQRSLLQASVRSAMMQ